MSLICKQPFIKVLREIDGNEQKYLEKNYSLYLYETKVVTPFHTFKINSIFDVSYRKTKNNTYGTLYLHTNQGVFPYIVCQEPDEFLKQIDLLI